MKDKFQFFSVISIEIGGKNIIIAFIFENSIYSYEILTFIRTDERTDKLVPEFMYILYRKILIKMLCSSYYMIKFKVIFNFILHALIRLQS